MYLWIDYWTRNIGVSYAEIGIAFPYKVFAYDDFFRELPNLVREKKITTIVVGEAIGYDAYGSQKRLFEKAIQKIQQVVPQTKIVIQDEDLSTFEAQESLNSLGSKDHLDDIAASIILQRYLDHIQ